MKVKQRPHCWRYRGKKRLCFLHITNFTENQFFHTRINCCFILELSLHSKQTNNNGLQQYVSLYCTVKAHQVKGTQKVKNRKELFHKRFGTKAVFQKTERQKENTLSARPPKRVSNSILPIVIMGHIHKAFAPFSSNKAHFKQLDSMLLATWKAVECLQPQNHGVV